MTELPTPTSLSIEQLAMMLERLGAPIGREAIEADLKAGAPVNADGTIHLLHYAAWLAREVDRG